MIIIDISGIAVACASNSVKLDEHSDDELKKVLIRHLILNSIREVNVKFRKKYGDMIIAMDCRKKDYWRKKVFPEYKANRAEARKKNNKIPWKLMDEVLGELRYDLKDVFGYNVLYIKGAEADDVIGTLVKERSEQSSPEDVVIVSNDGDMKQMQKYPKVKQFSTRSQKFVIEKDTVFWLKEKCTRGDKKDGIPNIHSKVDHFVKCPGVRQKAVTKGFLGELMNVPVETVLTKEQFGRYKQNEMLIDFEMIPQYVKTPILEEYNAWEPSSNQGRIFDYLSENRLVDLFEYIADFK